MILLQMIRTGRLSIINLLTNKILITNYMKTLFFIKYALKIILCGWLLFSSSCFANNNPSETSGGWVKYANNPLSSLSHKKYGTIFDISVLKENGKFRMWVSWRPKNSIALVESSDGINWSEPIEVLLPDEQTGLADNSSAKWLSRLNRPVIVKKGDTYHMWFTGQEWNGTARIGYATSKDGVKFEFMNNKQPVLNFEPGTWEDQPTKEKPAVICPHVIWDNEEQILKMWYSAGDSWEPLAIGLATSTDGINWTKRKDNPIFTAEKDKPYEVYGVGACQVIKNPWGANGKQGYLMFYISYKTIKYAQISMAFSEDGVTNWVRYENNPIISPSKDGFDRSACYKPCAVLDGNKWLLWYNGRNGFENGVDGGGGPEQMALVTHEGADLEFPKELPLSVSGHNSKGFIKEDKLSSYIKTFNKFDDELYIQDIPNSQAEEFLKNNIPLLDCPDKQLEQTYYFRWWTYRKHIKQTPAGYVISEFLPDVYWSGKYNSISCAAAHHFYEGRWLHNKDILDEYARFWFTGGGNPRLYSFWVADAIYKYHTIHPNNKLIKELYPYLKDNFAQWEKEKRDSTNMFWQRDDRDGMEFSVSGKFAPEEKGYRPTINSYMYAEALALSKMAEELGNKKDEKRYRQKAQELKKIVNDKLWDEEAGFYKVIPLNGKNEFSPTRELHAYTPWYFNIPSGSHSRAWLQLTDEDGFCAPYGPTTAEQRSPYFTLTYEGHECQWNGPSWPFSTSVTLVGFANLLNNYQQDYVSKVDYITVLKQYSTSHQRVREDGSVVPWIDENLNPYTGDWISRTRLKEWKDGTWDSGKGGVERGKDYNHSLFCDLVINGLMGFRPQEDDNDEIIINPIVPEDWWEYFCLDNIPYKNHIFTIMYDKFGKRYNKGQGFMVFMNGELIKRTDKIGKLEIEIE